MPEQTCDETMARELAGAATRGRPVARIVLARGDGRRALTIARGVWFIWAPLPGLPGARLTGEVTGLWVDEQDAPSWARLMADPNGVLQTLAEGNPKAAARYARYPHLRGFAGDGGIIVVPGALLAEAVYADDFTL